LLPGCEKQPTNWQQRYVSALLRLLHPVRRLLCGLLLRLHCSLSSAHMLHGTRHKPLSPSSVLRLLLQFRFSLLYRTHAPR
ncbi:hypothetical protein, partial [Streptomyces sp. P17]|uniref:hypothetical protein n=1 Tax=Streptomyces sp. P17 TaxID=3074716 RepID=UPI0028F3F78F